MLTKGKYLLALDQGTTSSRAIIFTREGRLVKQASREIHQIYPQPGWVEHSGEEIWDSQIAVARQVLQESGIQPEEIAGIGIADQRETVLIWDRITGKPVHNALVWQCRRTAQLCKDLTDKGWTKIIKDKTGLVIDAYFSGTKIKWLLDNIPGLRRRACEGEVLCGTIDTWLIWKLTGGAVHATDFSNASRTMLFNIHSLQWDQEILRELDIPEQILPAVKNSSDDFGWSQASLLGQSLPIRGVAGDQQAALFGQCCFESGSAKNTYGTGCFMLSNTGETAISSKNGLLTTIAWGLDGKITYALEGSIFIGGAVIQWLRDEIGILHDAAESEDFARKVSDTGGVYLVPAFVGLGAPHWDMYARGVLAGLTRGTNKYHIARAALESIAYQTRDVLTAMVSDAGLGLKRLRVDGGAARNDFLMQFQADILQVAVDRPLISETTALGAAFLAGLGSGVYENLLEIEQTWLLDKTFTPQMSAQNADMLHAGWVRALERTKGWV